MTSMLKFAPALLGAILVAGAPALPARAADKAADPVVAKVDGATIKRSDVVREINTLGPQVSQIPIQTLYPQVLERLIATQVVAAKGYAEKLENKPEAKERLKRAEEQVVADLYLNQTIMPKITEDKIKARYNEIVKKVKPEDEVRARHILVPTEAEAKEIIEQLKNGADFAKLAAEKSKDSGSMKEGGDLGYFGRGAMVKPFADAAFEMKPGELSDKPVKTDFGWHVIKVEDKRKSSPPPMEAVQDQIRTQLGNEMMTDIVKGLVAKAKVERYNIDGSPLPPAGASAKATQSKDDPGKKN